MWVFSIEYQFARSHNFVYKIYDWLGLETNCLIRWKREIALKKIKLDDFRAKMVKKRI